MIDLIHRPVYRIYPFCIAFLLLSHQTAPTLSLPAVEVITEIVKDQIMVPATAKSAIQILKATDPVGDEIYYLASVGTDSTGASTTAFLDTETITTTTNAAGSTVIGVPLSLEISATLTTTLVPTTAISTVLSAPPTVAFTTVDANGDAIVDIGQEFVRKDGSTFTAVLMSDVSTTSVTTVIAQGSTVVQTVAVLTAVNGSTVLDPLSFDDAASSSIAADVGFVSRVKAAIQQGLAETHTTIPSSINKAAIFTGLAADTQQGMNEQSKSISSSTLSARLSSPSSRISQTSQTVSNPITGSNGSTTSSATSMVLSNPYPSSQTGRNTSSRLLAMPSIRTAGSHTGDTTFNALSMVLNNPNPDSQPGRITPSGLTVASSIPTGGYQSRENTLSASSATRSIPTASSTGIVGGEVLGFAGSDSAVTAALGAQLSEQLPTITTVPPGMTVETVKSTTCTTAGAMVTTMAAGSTTTEEVPRLCANGFALFLFGAPKIPQLCKSILKFLGFLVRFLCDPQTDKIPIGFDLISYPGDPNNPDGESDPDDSSDEDPSGTISLPSPSRPSTLITSSLSSAVSSTSSSSASGAIVTGTFEEIVSNLITASVPIPVYATGLPGIGVGSSVAVANSSLDGLFSTLAVNVTSWLAAYTALSVAYTNGIHNGQSNVTTARSSCVIST